MCGGLAGASLRTMIPESGCPLDGQLHFAEALAKKSRQSGGYLFAVNPITASIHFSAKEHGIRGNDIPSARTLFLRCHARFDADLTGIVEPGEGLGPMADHVRAFVPAIARGRVTRFKQDEY